MTATETLQDKLKAFIKDLTDRADQSGTAHFDTSHAYWYGWDADIYQHRHEIDRELTKRGYHVESITRFEVTDYYITKKLDLS